MRILSDVVRVLILLRLPFSLLSVLFFEFFLCDCLEVVLEICFNLGDKANADIRKRAPHFHAQRVKVDCHGSAQELTHFQHQIKQVHLVVNAQVGAPTDLSSVVVV